MISFNQATIIGNLTRDIELRVMPNGTKVGSFSMATNKSYKDKNGQKVEQVEFHNLVAFGKIAEILEQYVKKGHQLMVQGELRTQSWDDKETGKKMYKTEIVVSDFKFGSKPVGSQQTESPEEVQRKEAIKDFDKQEEPKTTAPTSGVEYPDEDIDPSDISF